MILTKDHDPDAKCTVFHNDIRSFGKDFERYFQRADDLPDTRFIRSYASVAGENPETKNIKIRYATADEGVKEEEFDMVVLSVGLNPPKAYKEIADKFQIDINDHGFCDIDSSNPVQTSRPGIFVSGAFQGPTDIPESVFSASGAGSRVGEMLNFRRGKLGQGKNLSGRTGCLHRRTPDRCVCVPLRGQYFQRGQCTFHCGICQDFAPCGVCPGTDFFVCHQFGQRDHGSGG